MSRRISLPMCRISFPAPSLFREKRLIHFAKEKYDIPVPYAHEDCERTLDGFRSERNVFRKKYRQSIDALPGEPAIAPDVLRSLPDDEADLVFGELKSEGMNAEDLLLLDTRRKVERGLEHCKQQVHEQLLLVNALKDVSKAQTLIHEYMRDQTARENRGVDPDQSKRNKSDAFALLEIISEIGNGKCRFPQKEKKVEIETEEEREKSAKSRKEFRYHCIRDWEALCDEKGKPVLSPALMRSLALLHLHFNNLDVDRAMDAKSIALAEHDGKELLALARSNLDPTECKLLLDVAKTLRSADEPAAEDFSRYPAMIEKLPAASKLILTLLHRDIAEAHPRDVTDKYYGREDLLEQHHKGGNIVTDTERAVIMREMIEYLADYTEALAEAEETDEESDGFTVSNAYRVYQLLRENARKYLFQSGINYICLTGSDHGMKHLIQGDVRFCTKVAEQLKWSVRDRVCLRQIAADHDLGYTHAALQRFSMHEDGIPLKNGYYELLKDHPLYSSAYFEAHRLEYEEFFGKQGVRNMGLSILDHSEVKGHLRDPDHAKRMQALFCRIDCMAVSADLKNAPAFMDDKVLVAMSKAMEASEYLKEIDERLEKLWKEDKVRTDEYSWLSTIQSSLRTIAGEVKRYLLGLSEEIYKDRVYQQAYSHAVDQHYDPFNPTFPVQRDFGSNAIEFDGIDVHSTKERDYLTARFSVRSLLFFIADYFGREEGASFATSAIKKVLEDFGGAVHNPSKLVEALNVLSHTHEQWHTGKDIERNADGGVEYEQHHATHVHFEFATPKLDEKSPLIDRMTALLPSLRVMRELLRFDFDTERLKSALEKFAEATENSELLASAKKKEIEGATEHFLTQHFRLPT